MDQLLCVLESAGEARLACRRQKRKQLWELRSLDARIRISRGGTQQRYAAELRRVDLVEAVMISVDVDVRPIAQIKRWDCDGGGVVVVVVAAGRVGRHVGDELVARAL